MENTEEVIFIPPYEFLCSMDCGSNLRWWGDAKLLKSDLIDVSDDPVKIYLDVSLSEYFEYQPAYGPYKPQMLNTRSVKNYYLSEYIINCPAPNLDAEIFETLGLKNKAIQLVYVFRNVVSYEFAEVTIKGNPGTCLLVEGFNEFYNVNGISGFDIVEISNSKIPILDDAPGDDGDGRVVIEASKQLAILDSRLYKARTFNNKAVSLYLASTKVQVFNSIISSFGGSPVICESTDHHKPLSGKLKYIDCCWGFNQRSDRGKEMKKIVRRLVQGTTKSTDKEN